jgi:hypothetical protein
MSINVINRIYLGQIGRVPVIEQHEKLSYLNEHISYEVIMLNYTFMRLVTLRSATSEEELDRNAFLESFGIHARNLVDFFTKRMREDDRTASDYLPAFFEAPNQDRIAQALFRLEQQVLRISTLRKPESQGKFDSDDARELYGWIVRTVLKFQGELAERYREALDCRGQVASLMTSTASPTEQMNTVTAFKSRFGHALAPGCVPK